MELQSKYSLKPDWQESRSDTLAPQNITLLMNRKLYTGLYFIFVVTFWFFVKLAILLVEGGILLKN